MVSLVLGFTLTAVSPATAELPTRPRDPWGYPPVRAIRGCSVAFSISKPAW